MPRSSAARKPDPQASDDTLALLDQLAQASDLQAARQPRTIPDPEEDRPDNDREPDEPDEPLADPAEQPDEEPEGEPEGEPDEEEQLPADPPASAALAGALAESFVDDGSFIFEGEITPPSRTPEGAIRYTSRISIIEAWQYPGNVIAAPAWIDRNWVAYDPDRDPLRGIEPGPCLRVPLPGDPEAFAICRIGDYLALQQVALDRNTADTRVEVWARSEFQKLFMPREAS